MTYLSPIQQFQVYDKYARYLPDKKRRETFPEIVERVMNYIRELSGNKLRTEDYIDMKNAMLNMDVLPSMRLVAMAGRAAERDNVSIYNCAYLPIDSWSSFVELLAIAMAGTGIGFSVEYKYTKQIPRLKRAQTEINLFDHLWFPNYESHQNMLSKADNYKWEFVIPDTTEGWIEALNLGLLAWSHRNKITFDYSRIRPAGTPLKTKGGVSSGYKPLKLALDMLMDFIWSRKGRKLSSIELFDMACILGDAVVSGGVRRTAMLALFDFNDTNMRNAKNGDFPSWRYNANISANIPPNISEEDYLDYVTHIFTNNNGEPGLASRYAMQQTVPARRNRNQDFGLNPCGEIQLLPRQFCNLSMAIARPNDTEHQLRRKVRIASMIGTIQASATYFPYLPDTWKINCQKEALLGVDLTGQLDCKLIIDALLSPTDDRAEQLFGALQAVVLTENKRVARILGISPAAAATCVKPSGNSSVLADSGSGLHPRFARYYKRNVRVNKDSPIYAELVAQGVPITEYQTDTLPITVATFVQASPKDAITRHDLTAIQQLTIWRRNKLYWTEHNPSVTIYYEPHEVEEIKEWLYAHRHIIGGLTFFPKAQLTNNEYLYAPMEEIDEATYYKLSRSFSFDRPIELSDFTTSAQEVACSSGVCDLII